MEEQNIFNVSDLPAKFPHQWLAVKVLEREPLSGQPTTVEVISKNADIYNIRVNLGRDEFCMFYTGPTPEEQHVAMF